MCCFDGSLACETDIWQYSVSLLDLVRHLLNLFSIMSQYVLLTFGDVLHVLMCAEQLSALIRVTVEREHAELQIETMMGHWLFHFTHFQV